jgi:hypothetical protein
MRTKTVVFNLPTGPVERVVRDMTFHATSVQRTGSHGYPYRAHCSECGWQSKSYASAEAADTMGFAHTQDD